MSFAILLSIIALCSCIHYTPEVGVSAYSKLAFDGWSIFFNKTYTSTQSRNHAFVNYIASVSRVARKNKEIAEQGYNTVFGLTKFADLSEAEFRQLYLMDLVHRPQEGNNDEVHILSKRSELEEEQNPSTPIDWVAKGGTSPVKNQLQCGSCWAFSATETIESVNIIHGKLSRTTPLSPQMIVDCDKQMYGCQGGWPNQAMEWTISAGGLDTLASYPYTAVQGTCASANGTIGARIKSVVHVAPNEHLMYRALEIMPLSICADAQPWMDYSGGIFPANQCSTTIDHAIQITGYSPNQGGYWVVRNSWGTDWGLNGFIYLQYGRNTCGLNGYVYYATV